MNKDLLEGQSFAGVNDQEASNEVAAVARGLGYPRRGIVHLAVAAFFNDHLLIIVVEGKCARDEQVGHDA